MFLFFALIMNVGAFAVAFRYFVYDAVLKCGSQSVFVFFSSDCCLLGLFVHFWVLEGCL